MSRRGACWPSPSDWAPRLLTAAWCNSEQKSRNTTFMVLTESGVTISVSALEHHPPSGRGVGCLCLARCDDSLHGRDALQMGNSPSAASRRRVFPCLKTIRWQWCGESITAPSQDTTSTSSGHQRAAKFVLFTIGELLFELSRSLIPLLASHGGPASGAGRREWHRIYSYRVFAPCRTLEHSTCLSGSRACRTEC
ncbi:hypothetical protein P154DRAFT_270959 [Amniculicola lignicola CBS 123094]|uniref:Uncharacterized protein n=1 Tax=Amniculicola lignicola CBS 123094 TaxID=1392246 RepID=A0A6A5WB04_9PLEO|nr:hypothetical protein P154DRAFT_270959 [Amniculicola lignicola CBS 123094]